MAQEDADPIRRQRGWAVAELVREDLDLFSVADLEERIEALDAEVARCKARIDRKQAGKAAADAVFSKPG